MARKILAAVVVSVAPAVTAAVGTGARGTDSCSAEAASAERPVMAETAAVGLQQMEDEEEKQHSSAGFCGDRGDGLACGASQSRRRRSEWRGGYVVREPS